MLATAEQPPAVRPASRRAPIEVGLLWHSARSGNLGIGALTLGNIALVREVAADLGLEPRFTILSMRDAETSPIVGDDVAVRIIDSRAILDPRRFASWAGAMDCVLDIGAGDSFADIYGWKRFAFLWLSKMETVARGVPLILSPQTIGPFRHPVYRWFAARAMNRADAVVARDDVSLALAREMCPNAHTALACDVAFVLPYDDNSHQRGGARLRVGVNASGLLMRDTEAQRDQFGLSYDYAVFTRTLIAALQARPDVEVHLVPHATSKAMAEDDDGRWAARLAEEFPGVVRVPDFAGPSEAKSYISGLDFLVAARMHACVAAFSSGTPVVPVAYSPKFAGLFGMLGYDRVAPTQGLDADGMVAFVLKGLDERADLRVQIDRGMREVQGRLDNYRKVLADTFARVAQRSAAAT